MNITKKKCQKIKRILLIFVILPFISIIPYTELGWFRSLYYIIPTSGISTYIILLNFPCIVEKVHSRPLYFHDLEDNRDVIDPIIKKRFQMIFIIILQINLTILVSVLIYYYYDQFHTTGLSKMEIFGVLGGFISMMLKIENCIGKFTLSFVSLCKNSSIANNNRLRSTSLELIAIV